MNTDPAMARLHSRLKMRHMVLLQHLGANANIRRAAMDMNISQPSASALLREIEDALRVELFVRGAQGLRPTPFGETMIGWASIILADLEQASADLGALARGAGARVRVGVSPIAVPDLLPRAMTLFRANSPEATVAVQTGIAEALVPLLLAGELDCVVARMLPDVKHAGLVHHILYSEGAAVVVRRDHPLAGRSAPTGEEIDRYRWILPVGGGSAYDIVGATLMAIGGRLPQVAVETWSTIVIANLLTTSDLIAVVPGSIARAYADQLCVLQLGMPDLLYPVVLMSRPHPPTDVVFERFIAAVKQASRERDAASAPGDSEKRSVDSAVDLGVPPDAD